MEKETKVQEGKMSCCGSDTEEAKSSCCDDINASKSFISGIMGKCCDIKEGDENTQSCCGDDAAPSKGCCVTTVSCCC